jgi:hypothetical protein
MIDFREYVVAVKHWFTMKLPSERFDAMVRGHATYVEQSLHDEHKDWMPKLEVMTEEPPHTTEKRWLFAMACPFNEDAEKKFTLEKVAAQLVEARQLPLAIILSAEAWSAPEAKGVKPRHHSLRREIMMIMAEGVGVGKNRAFLAADIVRANGAITIPTGFGPIERDAEPYIFRHFWTGFLMAVGKELMQHFGENELAEFISALMADAGETPDGQ